jgi:hypothetical protein
MFTRFSQPIPAFALVLLWGACGCDTPADSAPSAAPPEPPALTAADQEEPAAGVRTVTFGDVTALLPETWKEQTAGGQFRLAQFGVPRAEGDPADPQLIVFHFGRGGAGSIDENHVRWLGMMSKPAGSEKERTAARKVVERDGIRVTHVDLAGTYQDRPFPMSQQFTQRPNYRMLAAVVETTREGGDGPYYIRLVGPAKSVAAAKDGWDRLIASLKPR